jgi:hypothetical protein
MKVEKLIRNLVLASKTPRWRRAFIIALLSDALGFLVVLFPPLQWTLDAVTAVALVLILGFRWKLMLAMAIEVIPGIELFPAWTLVILAMAATEPQKSIENTHDSSK